MERSLEKLLTESWPPGRLKEVERESLQRKAIDCLVHQYLDRLPPPPEQQDWEEDVVYFQLIPFFSRALAWPDMSYTYFPDYFGPDTEKRPYLYALGPAGGEGDDFSAFLQAGAARVLVAVHPAYATAILYYLASEGRFWFGEAGLTPVFEQDVGLVNRLKSMTDKHCNESGKESWELRVATPMIWLQGDERLPDFRDKAPACQGGEA